MVGRKNPNRPPKPKPKKIKVPEFPTIDNCDVNNPEEFALWALVGLPGQKGAPLPMPEAGLRLVSRRLWQLGFRYHPDKRELKYRKPRSSDPNWLTSPGTWVDINEPDEDDPSAEEIAKSLSSEAKAALRKRFGLDDPPPEPKIDDEKIPFMRKNGSTVPLTKEQLGRWQGARKAQNELKNNPSSDARRGVDSDNTEL